MQGALCDWYDNCSVHQHYVIFSIYGIPVQYSVFSIQYSVFSVWRDSHSSIHTETYNASPCLSLTAKTWHT
jgi:hypothetical protein